MTVDVRPDDSRSPAVGPSVRPVRLELLGGFALLVAGAPISLGVNARRLLALLALRGPLIRLDTAGVLWPDVGEAQALGSLRTTLWRLARVSAGLVAVRHEQLQLAPHVEVDLRAFLDVSFRLENRQAPDVTDVAAFGSTAAELLPGWYEDWVLTEQERVRQLRMHGWEAIASHLCRAGRYTWAVDAVLEAIRLEPLRESPHRVLLEIHLREGNVVEALRAFRAYSTLLHQELGVAPSDRLISLISGPEPPWGNEGT